MQKIAKRIGAVGLAACLLAALAFGGVMAWAQDSGLGGQNSLTANVSPDPDGDIDKAPVKVSVYKIGTATKDGTYDTYNYSFDAGFTGITGYEAQNMTGAKWQDIANQAAKLVADGAGKAAVSDVPAGEAITGLSDGLFLVIAGDADSASNRYKFNPTVVALPTKEPLTDDSGNVIVDADGYPIINTAAEYGPWVSDATISLKWEKAPLYGSLRIIKKVSNFSGSPASFVFHIEGKTPSGETYDNVAQVYYTGGESAETTVTHIPAGTKLKVTEAYEGSRFEPVDADTSEKTIIADEDVSDKTPVIAASFSNEMTPELVEGHGIENNFKLDEDGDWKWSAVPDTSVTDKPANN